MTMQINYQSIYEYSIFRYQVAEFDLLCVKHKVSMPELLLKYLRKVISSVGGRQLPYPQVPGLYFIKSFQNMFPFISWSLHIFILMWVSILRANNVLKKSQNPYFLIVAFLAYFSLPFMTLDIAYHILISLLVLDNENNVKSKTKIDNLNNKVGSLWNFITFMWFLQNRSYYEYTEKGELCREGSTL